MLKKLTLTTLSAVALTTLSAVALAFAAIAPANAAIICDDDECKPAIILPGPLLPIGIDDDCHCED